MWAVIGRWYSDKKSRTGTVVWIFGIDGASSLFFVFVVFVQIVVESSKYGYFSGDLCEKWRKGKRPLDDAWFDFTQG